MLPDVPLTHVAHSGWQSVGKNETVAARSGLQSSEPRAGHSGTDLYIKGHVRRSNSMAIMARF